MAADRSRNVELAERSIIATPHSKSGSPLPTGGSPWRPFRHRSYTVVWTATVVANIGGWMYSAAAAWLMTELTTDPLLVSLVQVATSLPMSLFALVAGAITDVADKRRYLIGVEIAILVVSAIFATLVTFGQDTERLSHYSNNWRNSRSPGALKSTMRVPFRRFAHPSL